jgi:hypothetical protein
MSHDGNTSSPCPLVSKYVLTKIYVKGKVEDDERRHLTSQYEREDVSE